MNLDQCLFGYEDGHRLLASSMPLGDALSLLTELSDLAPGTIFGDSTGYWTGLPVASLGRYVLMRTWPAPEMARPGCVWTHALLIEPALLERIDDLSLLQSWAIRPEKLADSERYREKINISSDKNTSLNHVSERAVLMALLSSLYGSQMSPIEIQRPGELDEVLFAVWSQQWPRLRRNFRFQTAASRILKNSSAVRFDAMASLVAVRNAPVEATGDESEWLSAAANDIKRGTNGTLRAFLWHYGRDVRRQRGSFKPLVQIHLLNNSEVQNSAEYLTKIVTDAFPEFIDAGRLKQDLIDGILVPNAQAELVLNAVERENNLSAIFPLPSASGVERLAGLWPSHSDALLTLIEFTEHVGNELIRDIHDSLLCVAETDVFWQLSFSHPLAQAVMVKKKPWTLFEAKKLPDEGRLAELICFIPEGASGLDGFVASLLTSNDAQLINNLYQYFPELTASVVITGFQYGTGQTSSYWQEALFQRPSLLLRENVLGQVPRTRILLDIARYLGWFTHEVMSAGISPWYQALLRAHNDIHGEDMEVLGCFLLVIACHSGREEGLSLVEIFYNAIHKKILDDDLSPRAAELLYPSLPEIGWFKNWDLGQRFRLLIVRAFVTHHWSPERFSSLAREKKGRILLAEAIAEVPGGHRFLQADSE